MEEVELFEKYFNGELSEAERSSFENRMKNDPEFRNRAESHFAFLKSLHLYGERKALKQTLDDIHGEMESVVSNTESRWKKSWPTIAVAASVALICTVGTFIALRFNDNEHQVKYQELKITVDKLNQSHKKILNDIKANQRAVVPSKYRGTGFLISPNGYIVTSYHVVRSADSIFVENEKFGRLKVALIYHNPETDVAILVITDPQFKALPGISLAIRKAEGNLGEAVYTLGFPRDEIVYNDGTISATSGFEQNENSYQISIPVNPGNSGGPMLDQQGAVIGIINGVQTESRGAAFAVKSGVLWDAINSIPKDSLSVPLKLNNINQLAALSRVNQIHRLREYVFVVKVHGK